MPKAKILVNVGFYSEFPKNLAETKDIVAEGAIGFKLFMGSQVGGLNIDNDQALQEAFKEVAKLKVPLAVHAEDKCNTDGKRGETETSPKKWHLPTFCGHTQKPSSKKLFSGY